LVFLHLNDLLFRVPPLCTIKLEKKGERGKGGKDIKRRNRTKGAASSSLGSESFRKLLKEDALT